MHCSPSIGAKRRAENWLPWKARSEIVITTFWNSLELEIWFLELPWKLISGTWDLILLGRGAGAVELATLER
jgi:hypothetical protein